MSENALKSLKDENPDLQKQIGCIAGFFQLFDRHRFLTGQSTSSYIQDRPTSVESNNDNKELNSKMQKTKAKNLKSSREKQQFSTESSAASVSSSSCSSSMSSIEFNRTIQTESPTSSQITVATNPPSKITMKQHDTSTQKSLEFCDIVKDSMYREPQGLSLKTKEKKGQSQTHTLKHIDSPRPLQPHKSINGGVNVVSKSKKSPWDSPRLSYDGRTTQDKFKSATKHKELPRLSLDSKQGSTRGFNGENKAQNLLKDPHKGNGRHSSTVLNLNQLQEPETSRRSSSVVAKLMGLEALPERTQTCGSSDDTITNIVTPYSRFALEPSPWRKPDARKSSQLQDSKGNESNVKASKSSLSVYGEIEKRVSELEFKKSGKDLRALKQILDAMQRYKDTSDTARGEALNSPSSSNQNNTSISESPKVKSPRIQQKDVASVTVEKSNSSQGGKLPIVIMKPAKFTSKAGLSKCSPSTPRNGRLVDNKTAKGISSTTKNTEDKNNNLRASKLMQSSKVPQDINGVSTANSGNMTVTGSPRLQKKFGFERRSPPTSPSSDSSIGRRKHNRQPVELSSPRQNFSTLQERNERFADISNHWRGVKHHVNVISPDFDRKRSLATHSDIEVIHIDQSGNINSAPLQLSDLNQSNVFEELRKESSKADTMVNAEQPSPVSVLDAAFYREDPPSPVRKKSDTSTNLGETLSTDDDRDLNTQNLVEILKEIDWIDEKFLNYSSTKDPDHKYISEILLTSGLLSGHSSSQILHSPGHLISPKLFFALEEIKTNKRDFSIEDSAKKISRIMSPGQMQRKLIFDVVNDILVQKLILGGSSTLRCLPNELEGRKLKGQKLFYELCTEIDQLQPQNRNDVSIVHEDENLSSLLCGDLKHHHPIWTNCCSEIPNVVLDIERLIFKDLITEAVRGEVANLCGRHCRQLLFPK